MNKEIFKKYSFEMLILTMFITTGVIFKFKLLGEKNIFLLSILTTSYILLNSCILKIVYKSSFPRLIVNIMFAVDILILFMGTINLLYIIFYHLIYLLFLLVIYKTEGIVRVKRGVIFYILYGIFKIVFVYFLLA
ncbi:hypothetical protein KX935_07485 [Streptobacillus moniliformis]|uniref:Uncharacterized protein n=1 Tax=Streptobacillus moniliformis (strain ATCC 14647 / DSM 12112 / NCTC 10651 / 9901) TaxID=519441 RepID=D1AX17_STRM9|nr:hypothetical protein [Streptobacillus moniliformis]ACZ00843.1 hypothetical protein Smon_0359 [Streptobacillus moniliformis DSM 12112]AVL42765.1 hypothetical protein CEP89_02405 [Streptobacillus moniliformis]QXW65592.1 hypothetical protein KX935_07485 [Streptobacillus moniliformis]SQA14022.1 Uncharacterised protein [Streptobacillus moniliformis]